jgi:pSer/pThr/pTyr-binding forkhead associated (FHA) protein
VSVPLLGMLEGARVARDEADGRIGDATVPELILSLRERELTRFSIAAASTTIGRDPGCDVVIDNAGISRLHASIEVLGDSFVLRDCDSENGITLNGEPCREGRLVHGDIVGLNKFLLRFSNQTLEVPTNLQPALEKPRANQPRDVQRTMHVDRDAAQALVALSKLQIERQRAEIAARGGESAPAPPHPERANPARPRPPEPLRWEEPEGSGQSLTMLIGAVVVGVALLAVLLYIIL